MRARRLWSGLEGSAVLGGGSHSLGSHPPPPTATPPGSGPRESRPCSSMVEGGGGPDNRQDLPRARQPRSRREVSAKLVGSLRRPATAAARTSHPPPPRSRGPRHSRERDGAAENPRARSRRISAAEQARSGDGTRSPSGGYNELTGARLENEGRRHGAHQSYLCGQDLSGRA